MKKKLDKAKKSAANEITPAKSYIVSGGGVSKDFFELVKNVGEATSRAEEEIIIKKEATVLKKLFKENVAALPKAKKRDLLLRTLYVHMLGQDASFGYILAINMTQEQTLLDKRVGYLIVSLFLSEEDERLLLVVNSVRRDLSSTNYLEVCAALGTLASIASADIVPALEDVIYPLKDHSNSIVRKKVAVVLNRFCQKMGYRDTRDKIGAIMRRLLCDPVPSVMAATLPYFLYFARNDPEQIYDLIPSLASILKQVVERRLSIEYDYHGVPAPWMQIQLLRVISHLGRGSQERTLEMSEIIVQVLKRTSEGVNAASAAVCLECIKTVSMIEKDDKLVEMAARATSRLLKTKSANLRFLGIRALNWIVNIVPPSHIVAHQEDILHCLESEDFSLKVKTLHLLVAMANPKNLDLVVDKLLENVALIVGFPAIRTELLRATSRILEENSQNSEYLVRQTLRLFEVGRGDVPEDIKNNSLRLLAEGISDSEASERIYRARSVESFASVVAEPKNISPALLEVAIWFLGEFGYLNAALMEKIVHSLERFVGKFNGESDSALVALAVTALLKLSVQLGHALPSTLTELQRLACSSDADIAQRSVEALNILREPRIAAQILPADASCEDVRVNEIEGVVKAVVRRGLDAGLSEYIPKEERGEYGRSIAEEAGHAQEGIGLKIDAYEPDVSADPLATLAASPGVATAKQPYYTGVAQSSTAIAATVAPPSPKPVKKLWGKDGYNKKKGNGPSSGEGDAKEQPKVEEEDSFSSPKPYAESKASVARNVNPPRRSSPTQQEKKVEKEVNPLFSGFIEREKKAEEGEADVTVSSAEVSGSIDIMGGEVEDELLSGSVSVEVTESGDMLEPDIMAPIGVSSPRQENDDLDLLGAGAPLPSTDIGDDTYSPLVETAVQSSGLHLSLALPGSIADILSTSHFVHEDFVTIKEEEGVVVRYNMQKCDQQVVFVLSYSFTSAVTHLSAAFDKINLDVFDVEVYNSPVENSKVGMTSEWKEVTDGVAIYEVIKISMGSIDDALKHLPLTLRVRLSYFDGEGKSKFCLFTASMALKDILIPFQIDGAGFEEKWTALMIARSKEISLETVSEKEDVRAASVELIAKLGIHLLEFMGSEFICAAQTIGSNLKSGGDGAQRLVLVHMEVSPVNFGQRHVYKFRATLKSDTHNMADAMGRFMASIST